MRRIVAHLIRGEAKEAHEAITRDLVEKFGTFPIHDRIAPHLTLKRWFELEEKDMKNVRKVLDGFARAHAQANYKLQDFGHFGEDVIYVDVRPSPEMVSAARDLMKDLHGVEQMTFDEFDDIEDDFHATVVMGDLKPFDYTQIWDYLNSKEGIHFDMKFDNIALMKRETDKWVLECVWELPVA